jgi:hypothetical protein
LLLRSLRLSNQEVLAREHARIAECGKVPAPWYIKAPFFALCWVLDVVYENRCAGAGCGWLWLLRYGWLWLAVAATLWLATVEGGAAGAEGAPPQCLAVSPRSTTPT